MAVQSQVRPIVRFGSFEVDLNAGELRQKGVRIKVQEQPFRILVVLLEHPGEIVTREHLRERLWASDTFVDFEHSLNAAIKKLRQALHDDAESPRFIETIPKRGYRFIAPVETNGSGTLASVPPTAASVRGKSPQQGGRHEKIRRAALLAGVVAVVLAMFGGAMMWRRIASTKPAIGKVMLAVLPFDNLSSDPSQDYFAEGMTEELITQLGRYNPERLGVIARTSAEQYRHAHKTVAQVGKELGVDYVVEGSARREGLQVRITAQLIQVHDQTHLWAKEYDREISDILKLQNNVALDLTREISVELSSRDGIQLSPHSVDPVAYDAYLQGRYYLSQRSEEAERKALAYFQLAIASDPDYAPAYAGIADSYAVLTIDAGLVPDEAFHKAMIAARRALELDDSLAEAHASLATLKMAYERDWAGSEHEYRRALELNPNYTLAHQWFAEYWMTTGHLPEALIEITKAQKLDPLSPMIGTEVGWVYYFGHQQDQAIEQYRRVLTSDPTFTYATFCMGLSFEQKGMYAEAIRLLQLAAAAWPNDPGTVAALSHAYASSGNTTRAKELLDDLIRLRHHRHVEPLFIADAYAGLHNKDEAFKWLNIYASRPTMYIASLKIKADPRLDNLRSDPHYRDLLQKMRLPQ